MKNKKYYYRWSDSMLDSPVACIIMGIIGIIGIIVGVILIVSQQ